MAGTILRHHAQDGGQRSHCTVCRYAGNRCVRHNRKWDNNHFGHDSTWHGKARAIPDTRAPGHFHRDTETLRCIMAEARSQTLIKLPGLSQPVLLQAPFTTLRWHDVEPQRTTLAALTSSLHLANFAHDQQEVSRCYAALQYF